MQLKSIFTLIAAGVALVMAESTSTTTSTSTMTQTKTITITECEPTATECPLYKPPKVNTTVSAAPSWSANGTSWGVPTQKPTGGFSSVVIVPTKSNPDAPIATGAASGLFLPSSLLLALAGAGAAILA